MKRATDYKQGKKGLPFYFNPRPREEGDQALRAIRVCGKYFNPRPREEGDFVMINSNLFHVISIHALVKRATRFIVYIITYLRISIHALVKRATTIFVVFTPIFNISIHALVKRATKKVGW